MRRYVGITYKMWSRCAFRLFLDPRGYSVKDPYGYSLSSMFVSANPGDSSMSLKRTEILSSKLHIPGSPRNATIDLPSRWSPDNLICSRRSRVDFRLAFPKPHTIKKRWVYQADRTNDQNKTTDKFKEPRAGANHGHHK